ncbi:alpha/beta fold hydrolase [Promicromonospora sukumoe]|uniref:alpha/beta fold hydrolase n=1 Tax=Promicromonospora sukumoe TaxID=88382 RepID=UPI0037C7C567
MSSRAALEGSSILLIHGAYHGGWAWKFFARILKANGAEVHTPTLTGLGDRSHLASPSVSLATHIQDIEAYIRYQEVRPSAVVAHSYGAMVACALSDRNPQFVKSLTLIDGYLPEDSVSVFDLQGSDEANSGRELLASTGFRPPPTVESLGIEDAEIGCWVSQRLVPHPLNSYGEVRTYRPAVERRSYGMYVSCIRYHKFQRFFELARRAGWRAESIDAGHDAMLTHPEELAGIVVEFILSRRTRDE